jgi:hypothetical protein
LAFIIICVASGISTTVIIKGVDLINQYGGDIGIMASKGTTFLAMTWTAMSALFLATLFSFL